MYKEIISKLYDKVKNSIIKYLINRYDSIDIPLPNIHCYCEFDKFHHLIITNYGEGSWKTRTYLLPKEKYEWRIRKYMKCKNPNMMILRLIDKK